MVPSKISTVRTVYVQFFMRAVFSPGDRKVFSACYALVLEQFFSFMLTSNPLISARLTFRKNQEKK